jgi:hypothetical protein
MLACTVMDGYQIRVPDGQNGGVRAQGLDA